MYSYDRDSDGLTHPCRFCGRPGACYAPPEGWPTATLPKVTCLHPDAGAAHLDCASKALGVRMMDLDTSGALTTAALDELARVHRTDPYAAGFPVELREFLSVAIFFVGFIGAYVVGSVLA